MIKTVLHIAQNIVRKGGAAGPKGMPGQWVQRVDGKNPNFRPGLDTAKYVWNPLTGENIQPESSSHKESTLTIKTIFYRYHNW